MRASNRTLKQVDDLVDNDSELQLLDPSFFKAASVESIMQKYVYNREAILKSTQVVQTLLIPDGILKIISAYLKHYDIGKNEAKRQRCIAELFQTEYTYIQSLNNYKKYYINPLEINRNILTKKQYDIICPKLIWNCLIKLHCLFYNDLYDKLLDFNDQNTTIGDILNKHIITNTNIYKSYTVHYVTNKLDKLSKFKNIDNFIKYEKRICQRVKPTSLSLSVPFCLICPNSRLHRILLLVKEKLKYIGDEHPDKILLSDILNRLTAICEEINQLMRQTAL